MLDAMTTQCWVYLVQDAPVLPRSAVVTFRNSELGFSLLQHHIYFSKTVKTVAFNPANVNIHSAQDNRLFFHSLEFSVSCKDSGVRVALVCRWLRPTKFFRNWPQEIASLQYCTVDPDVYEQLKGYRHKHQWQNCLGDSYHQLDLLYNR